MIKVSRPTCIPLVLRGKGLALNTANCALFDADSADYKIGKLKFVIEKKIYGHHTVKSALQKAQHGKCCYCEAKFGGTSYGAIEHYRPKTVSYQDESKIAFYPGYYWLGYDWSNLLYICTTCNNIKNAYFPLKLPANRTNDHNGSINTEEPLILNPATEDPSSHIYYHNDVPLGHTEEGRATIKYLELGTRAGLTEARLEALVTFNFIVDVTESLFNKEPEKHLRGLALIRKHLAESSPFSAMLNENFAKRAVTPALNLA